jgi:probable rRNA maturation factor
VIQIDVEVEDPAWEAALPQAFEIARRAGEAALDRAGAVAVLLTDDETLQDLNLRFRRKDAPTNVLSFPAPENPENHLGDVALAYGVCAREAAEQGKSLSAHLQHLVAHGVLHLVGFDHETDQDAAVMEARERDILRALGIDDPYA